MKLFAIISLLFVVLIIMWMTLLNRNPLSKVDKYRVYYGSKLENMEKEFEVYDALILESHYYTADDLQRLHDNTSTIYIGYLTVFEIPNWDIEFVKKVLPEDYLKVNNEYVINDTYNNHVGDIREESYRKLLLEELEKNIVSKGFDGVFFDTVDWIDYFIRDQEDVSKELLEGYLMFLKELKEQYPELIVIQNRSFWSFDSGSVKFVDGIMWENYTYSKAYTKERSKTWLLVRKQFLNHQKVFALSHKGKKEDETLAKYLNWSYFNNVLDSYSKWE